MAAPRTCAQPNSHGLSRQLKLMGLLRQLSRAVLKQPGAVLAIN